MESNDNPKRKNNPKIQFTLIRKMYLMIISVIFFSTVITGFCGLLIALNSKQQGMDTLITDTAYMLSENPEVKTLVDNKTENSSVISTIDLLVSSLSQIDVVSICTKDRIRVYHTNKDEIGRCFVGGDEWAILRNEPPYVSVATGTLGEQRRAFHAVYNDSGELIGFVMVSVLNSRLGQIRNEIFQVFSVTLFILLLVGLVLSGYYKQLLIDTLLGYGPEEFVSLYKDQISVINVLEEGLFAINTEGNIVLMNRSAKEMLGLSPDAPVEGTPLIDYYPETMLPTTIRTGKTEHNIFFTINGENIISSRMPIYNQGMIIGAASIFRNKTEVTKLAEKLTGAEYMVDTLRAFNHEFLNKLHVILGLLEINEPEKAKKFILDTSIVSGSKVSEIQHLIPIKTLAALIIGKFLRSSELGITMTLKQDSYFYGPDDILPADCWTTIVGNLLENSIYELN